MFSNDWIMRQIEMLAQGIAKLLHVQQNEDAGTVQQIVQDHIERTLKNNLTEQVGELIRENKLGEAEDLLFACCEQIPNVDFLSVGADMYKKMQAMTDEELLKASFPREEIADGIKALEQACENKPSMEETFKIIE